MKNLILLWTALFLSSAFGAQLKLKQDPVFKTLWAEFESPGSQKTILLEGQNYRFDLSLTDLVDKVSVITLKPKYAVHRSALDGVLNADMMNFVPWFKKLEELADADEDFLNILDRRLFVQLYSISGHALLPEYKFIDIRKLTRMGHLRRVTRFNEFMSDPESAGLLEVFKRIPQASFVTKDLTVAKMRELPPKFFRRLRRNYYEKYLALLGTQDLVDNAKREYPKVVFKWKNKKYLVARTLSNNPETVHKFSYTTGPEIFEAIYRSPNKNVILEKINDRFEELGISSVPVQKGLYLLTPLRIQKHLGAVKDVLREFALETYASPSDDEYIWSIRKWAKKNREALEEKSEAFLAAQGSSLDSSLPQGRRPSRTEILTSYDTLEKLFPERPWLDREYLPTFVDHKGKDRYFGDRTLGQRLKSMWRSVRKIENLTGLIIGTSSLVLSGGNYSIAMSLASLARKGVYTLKHGKEIEEFLKSAPSDVIGAFLLGAGFSSGRLYKVLALGAGQGAIQSAITGQDIKTGAIVGAGLSSLFYYALPYALNKPMAKGFDTRSLKINRRLELLEKTLKGSIQGALTAGFTGQGIGKYALIGGGYGLVSAQLVIWIYGTRYYPFKDYDPALVDETIALENQFQNEVGRGGEFAIDRRLILDTNFRVGGILPKAITASITLPGNVSMSDSGFDRLTTLTHEAHHLMQQHQSGVFGFYLFRYIPTAFKTGYKGHPDENFLRSVTGNY